MVKQARQGDVWIEAKPDGLKGCVKKIEPKGGRVILAEGEVTGHAHAIPADTCTLWEPDEDYAKAALKELFGMDVDYAVAEPRVVEVTKPTVVGHDEHGDIKVQPGIFWTVKPRQYTPAEIVRVRD